MSTPNYLGFLEVAPKQGVLQSAISGAMSGYGDTQNLIQQTEKTRVYPNILQSEIQKNSMVGLPPLDQATMAYVHAAQTLGEDHPVTQDLKTNYQTLLKYQQTLTDWHSIMAGAKDMSLLPENWRSAVFQSGAPIPQLGQGIPLGGGQLPSSQISSGQAPTNQGPIVGNVNGVSMTQPQINALKQLAPGQVGQQNIPQDNSQNARDIFQKEYSPEAKIGQAVTEEQQKENVKNTNELLLGKDGNGGYLGAGISSTTTLNSLNQFKKAYDDSMAKGAIGGLIFGKLDPSAQVAIKNASQLVMNNMQSLKGITNRWNMNEFKVLASGNPDIKLDPKAVEEIYHEMTTALNVIQEQGKLAYSVSKLTNNPADIQKIIGYATQKYNPVDSSGNIQSSYISKISKLATPEAVQAITSGKDYDPIIGTYSDDDLKHTAQKRNISVAEVKRQLGIR
ncbi:MAG: hypothetical protein WC917_00480 [Bacilli bacterium]|jgi:hypothetical protein